MSEQPTIPILAGEVETQFLDGLPGEWPWRCERPGCGNTAIYCPAFLVWPRDLPIASRCLGNAREVVLTLAVCRKCMAWATLDPAVFNHEDTIRALCEHGGFCDADTRSDRIVLAAKPLPDDPRAVWSPEDGQA